MRILFISALIAFSCMSAVYGANQNINGWHVATDENNGQIISMDLTNPATNLKIEQLIIFSNFTADGIPSSGTVTFTDNIQRPLTSQEVTYYFTHFEGSNAVWDYYASVNRVQKYTPSAVEPIPNNLTGRIARVVLQNGLIFFGKISLTSEKTSNFALAIDGACCGPLHIENSVVREIDVLERKLV